MDELNEKETPETPEIEPDVEITSDEKNMALLAHILGIVLSFLGPLIIWLIKKDESKFIDHHGKEALNFQLTMLIAYIVGGILTMVVIGACIMLAVWVLIIVYSIIAAMAANKGEWYKYPLTIRFIT
ncbi:DUF4870 domain-containing protein [bacterium]|nr:MAG: DUF4870 domain-containing protein [bacterium]